MPVLEDHPLAEIFPLMPDAELAALADDIEANGLREKVWLYEGKILDGRNRYRACVLKDVDHQVEHYRGKDPLGFVISKNLHRRHLTESQRAMAAARFANLQIDEGKAVRKTVATAAALFRVSPRSIDAARKVLDKGTAELVAGVESGEVSVSAAEKVADPAADQPTPPEPEAPESARAEQPAEPDAAPDEPQVSYGSAEDCRKVAVTALRKVQDARKMISGLMVTPFREVVSNLAASVTGMKLHAEDGTVETTRYGGFSVGHTLYSSDAFDGVIQFLGCLDAQLGREASHPVGRRQDGPAPWEADDDAARDIPI